MFPCRGPGSPRAPHTRPWRLLHRCRPAHAQARPATPLSSALPAQAPPEPGQTGAQLSQPHDSDMELVPSPVVADTDAGTQAASTDAAGAVPEAVPEAGHGGTTWRRSLLQKPTRVSGRAYEEQLRHVQGFDGRRMMRRA